MKTTTLIKSLCAITLSGLLAVCCSKPEPEPVKPEKPETPEVPVIGETVTLEITAEGEWADGDIIGLRLPAGKSLNVPASYKDGKFTAQVQTPEEGAQVLAYYPYSEIAADGTFIIELPAAVTGEEDLPDAMTAVPASISKVEETIGVDLVFQKVAGAVEFNLKDATEGSTLTGKSVRKLTITSDSDIAGKFAVSINDGNVTPAEGVKTVTITPAEGTVFGDGSLTFRIAAVPGNWSGSVKVQTEVSEQEFTVSGLNVSAGETATATLDYTVAYKPYTGITSAEDWNAFIAALIAGDISAFVNPETSEVDLNADIEFELQPEFPVDAENNPAVFSGVLNGNGKTLTCQAFTRPLFSEIGEAGIVKDLTIRGSFTSLANAGEAGNATITKVNKGHILRCSNYTDTELSVKASTIFGTIAAQNGGTIEECRNYGSIKISAAMGSSVAGGYYGGGISAIGHTVEGPGTSSDGSLNITANCRPGKFVKCENHGNIEILTSGGAAPIKSGFGGICGVVYLDDVRFENCANTGNITRKDDKEATKSSQYFSAVGGILGRSAATAVFANTYGAVDANATTNGYYTVIKNCSNSGRLINYCRHSTGVTTTDTGARKDGTGGIVGIICGKNKTAEITDCSNTGDVLTGWSAVSSGVSGGIAGTANNTRISGCSSKAVVGGESSNPLGAAGGIVGLAFSDVTVSGAKASNNIKIYTASKKTTYWGLCFGIIITSASIESGSDFSGSTVSVADAEQSINADNFATYLTSGSGKAATVAEGGAIFR